MAIFDNFENALIFQILAGFFLAVFCNEQLSCVFVETFFACFRQFYFLIETEFFMGSSLCIVGSFGNF